MSNIPIFYCGNQYTEPETMAGFGSFIKRKASGVASAYRSVTKKLGTTGTALGVTAVLSPLGPVATSAGLVGALRGQIKRKQTAKKVGAINAAKGKINAANGKIGGSDYSVIVPAIKETISAWGYVQRNDPAWAKSNIATVQGIWNKTGQVWLNNVRMVLHPFNVNLTDTASRMTSQEINAAAGQIMAIKSQMTAPGFINHVTTTSPGYKQGLAEFDAKIAALNKLAKMPRVKPGDSGGLPYVGSGTGEEKSGFGMGAILPIAAAGVGALLLLKG